MSAAELTLAVLSAVGALVASTALITWFMAEQFRKNRQEFYKSLQGLHNGFTMHLDNHRKEDREAFEELKEEIWQIRLRNASKDGRQPPPRPRRSDH